MRTNKTRQDPFTNGRQTGRTTRMLQAAIDCAKQTRQNVLIFCSSQPQMSNALHIVCNILGKKIVRYWCTGIEFWVDGDYVEIYFIVGSPLMERNLCGADIPYYFVDHSLYEFYPESLFLQEFDENLTNSWKQDFQEGANVWGQ